MYPCSPSIDTMGKENESLQVSLSFIYLSWCAFKGFIPNIIMCSPVPMSIAVICNRAKFTSLLSRHIWLCVYEFYAYFHLTIAVVVIGWCYGLFYVHLPAEQSEHTWCVVCVCIWNNFFGESKLYKYNLGCFEQVISYQAVCSFFYNRELCCSNLQCIEVIFFLNKKDTFVKHPHGLHETLYGIVFCCGCICWYSRHVVHGVTVFLMSEFIHYTNSLANNLVFLMPIFLVSNCSSICLCNREGIIILLPFMAIPSVITSSFLIDQ